MILLATALSLLQVVTGGSQTLNVHASYVDVNTSNQVTPAPLNTVIAATGTETITPGPSAANTTRNVKFLSVQNTDPTTAVTVTIQHYDGTTNVNLLKVSLSAGYTLTYNDLQGWKTIDNTGADSLPTLVGDVAGPANANTISNLAVSKLSVAGSSPGWIITDVAGVPTWAAAPTSFTAGGDLSGTGTSQVVQQAQSGAITFASTGAIAALAADTAFGLTQATPGSDLAVHALSITAQSAFATATAFTTGAALNLSAGASAGGAITAVGGAITLTPGSSAASVSGTGGNFNVALAAPVGAGSEALVNITRGGAALLALSYTAQVYGAAATCSWSQTTPTSVIAPLNMTWTSQQPNGGSGTKVQNTPGSFIFNTGTAGAVGTAGNPGWLQVQYAGATVFYAGAYTTPSSTVGCLWLSSNTPSATNYLAYCQTATTTLNAPSTLTLGSAGTVSLSVTSQNVMVCTSVGLSMGGAIGAFGMQTVNTAPTTAPTVNAGVLYNATLALKWFGGATGAFATTTLAPAPSAGTVNSQQQILDQAFGTCETVSSATPTTILAYTTKTTTGGFMTLTCISRATTIGTGIVVGDTATSVYVVGYRNIAGTVTLSTAGISLVANTNQTTVAALTAPVLTATVATNVITIKVTNVALCTIDSQVNAEISVC